MNINKVLENLKETQGQALARLFELIKIPSVSTDKSHKDDCTNAAEWLVNDLKEIGFDASVKHTSGHPIVLAHAGPKNGAPHLLFYGHYDVQPVDPINLWTHDPFDPQLEDQDGISVIRARGASDDKGQLMTFLEACRSIVRVNGELPCRITVLIEGEEESSSPSLIPFLEAHTEELQADHALVCDTSMWSSKVPAITTMLRGMLGEEITVIAANKDLHSGLFGGASTNPISVISDLISTLHDKDGRVTVPNFYKGSLELPERLKLQWSNLNFSEKEFLESIGLKSAGGEIGYSVLEKIWARPTCEVNGIWGGYMEDGFKTVIPSKAHAKISFRLVGNQNPEEIRENFRSKLISILPENCEIKFTSHGGSKATTFPISDHVFNQCQIALTEEWQQEALFIGSGGSIPIVRLFKDILNLDSILIGFGQADDQIHSPNEKYNLTSFQKGAKSWARIIHKLSL